MKWDLLIKGGTVVDPSQGLHRVADVAISGDKVAEVGPDLDGSDAVEIIDASGKIVTPGFIDLHTHNFVSSPKLPSLPVDSTSLARGATTVLDAGHRESRRVPPLLGDRHRRGQDPDVFVGAHAGPPTVPTPPAGRRPAIRS